MGTTGVSLSGFVHTKDGPTPLKEVQIGEAILVYFGRGVVGMQRLIGMAIENRPYAPLSHLAVSTKVGKGSAILGHDMLVATFDTKDDGSPTLGHATFSPARELKPGYVVSLSQPSGSALSHTKLDLVSAMDTNMPDLCTLARLHFPIRLPFFYNGILVSEDPFDGNAQA